MAKEYTSKRFREGDKVRIREWEDMEREFGLCYSEDIDTNFKFLRNMRYLCGQEFIIEEIKTVFGDSRVFGIDTANYISTDMIEHVEEGE